MVKVRNSLYVAGCMFHCEGCYNVADLVFQWSIPYTKKSWKQICDLAQPYVQGALEEPFSLQASFCPLVKRVKKLPDKDIWSDGYTWEEMMLRHQTN